jgi:hypothetical protein
MQAAIAAARKGHSSNEANNPYFAFLSNGLPPSMKSRMFCPYAGRHFARRSGIRLTSSTIVTMAKVITMRRSVERDWEKHMTAALNKAIGKSFSFARLYGDSGNLG